MLEFENFTYNNETGWRDDDFDPYSEEEREWRIPIRSYNLCFKSSDFMISDDEIIFICNDSISVPVYNVDPPLYVKTGAYAYQYLQQIDRALNRIKEVGVARLLEAAELLENNTMYRQYIEEEEARNASDYDY